ncbi:protein phosphatase 2C domain-containing protein, partial [Pararhodobacter sp. SW119]|uniref:protein phosphatase 2C domain-containing protein n=1 Tax=Pararhodobacter sp. SW119 TaxID=2780075 RepID=UPI001AE0304C
RVSQFDRRQAEEWLSEIRGRVAGKAKDLNLPTRELATTVTIALASRSHTFIVAVGDSPCVIHDGTQWLAPIWPMRGEYANQTFFITQDPIPSWDCALIEAKIDRLAILSDGIDKLVLRDRNREVFAPFFDGIFKSLGGHETVGRNRALSLDLKAFLASSRVNELTDDDKTLIVATRRARP